MVSHLGSDLLTSKVEHYQNSLLPRHVAIDAVVGNWTIGFGESCGVYSAAATGRGPHLDALPLSTTCSPLPKISMGNPRIVHWAKDGMILRTGPDA